MRCAAIDLADNIPYVRLTDITRSRALLPLTRPADTQTLGTTTVIVAHLGFYLDPSGIVLGDHMTE